MGAYALSVLAFRSHVDADLWTADHSCRPYDVCVVILARRSGVDELRYRIGAPAANKWGCSHAGKGPIAGPSALACGTNTGTRQAKGPS
jgi:hypothetical protein